MKKRTEKRLGKGTCHKRVKAEEGKPSVTQVEGLPRRGASERKGPS